jgi:hypothetical protein
MPEVPMIAKLRLPALGCLVLAALFLDTAYTSPVAAQAPLRRTVFASVVAKDGSPVTDLAAAEFEVKEGGKVQEITSVKLATMPLRVHVIVSDGGSGAFQAGTLRLVNTLIDRAQFAFTSVLVQPERVTAFTSDTQLLGAGIQRLGRRGQANGGSQLMEAMADALKDIASPDTHPVLIVLRIGGEGTSTVRPGTIREALRATGTTLFVISRTGASKAPPMTGGSAGMSPELAQQQGAESDRNEGFLNLSLVLGDGSRESGGSQLETPLTSALPALEKLAAEIKNQYEITYVLPAGTKPSDRLQVTTKRKDVTLRAPLKIAN